VNAPARILPHSDEAERTLVGGLLIFGRRAMEDIDDMVRPDDFYDAKHEAIYAAIENLRASQHEVNIVTVGEEMRRAGLISKLAAVGGDAYLAELANDVASPEGMESCARIVRDKSILRRVITESARISQLAYRDDRSVLEVVDSAQSAMMTLTDMTARREPKTFKQVLHTTITALRERSQRKNAITGVPSGLTNLDEMTGGFQPGQLIVVAGRPGAGKSAWAETFALHAAECGHPGLMFSLEMIDEEIGQRAMSADAGLDGAIIRSVMLRDSDWMRLTRSVQHMRDYQISVDDDGRQDLLSISAISRRWKKKLTTSAPGYVILDYMQLVQASVGRRHHSREREVAEISGGLKALAKELRVPVIALASLNRKCEDRPDKRPLISDLKESGSIESDANMVLLLYRDEMYNKYDPDKRPPMTDNRGIAEIIIGKNRGGATGVIEVAYIAEQTRFANLSRRSE